MCGSLIVFPCTVCALDSQDGTNEDASDNRADVGVKLLTSSAASDPLDSVEPPLAMDTNHQIDDTDGIGSDEVMEDDGTAAAAAAESVQSEAAAINSRSNSAGFVF